MNTTPEHQLSPENILAAQHAEWLKHPVTQQVLRNLEAYKQMFVNDGVNNSANFSMNDNYFRLQAHGTKTILGVIKCIAVTDNFVKLAQPQDK